MKHDDNNTETITHLSLCSGYEGIGLGLRRVLPNLREIAYVEREGFPVANLVAKMEAGEMDAAPVFTDVKTFPYRKFRGLVDILSGGFPCQPFSASGKREGVEDPRHLFPYIRDGIAECRPRLVFLENVEGIISSKTAAGESVLQYVLRELECLGYTATAGIFSASEVGAPHQRKRVFILGRCDPRLQRQEKSKQQTAGLEQSSQELAYPDGDRGQRPVSILGDTREIGQGREDSSEDSDPTPSWTARPSHPHYEWEEPRVLAHSERERRTALHDEPVKITGEQFSVIKGDTGKTDAWPARPGEAQHPYEEPRTTPPILGRTANGSSSRVDRLRLLGNGVVPAVAAKAFVTLINQLT